MVGRVVEPSLTDADGRFPRHVIVFAIMRKHFRVVVGRQVRVTQTEIAWEITDRVSLLLVLRQDRVLVGVVRRTDAPVDTYLAVGLSFFDGLVDVHNRASDSWV